MSKHRLFNLVIVIALVAVVLLTIREASATSSVIQQAEPIRSSHRTLEAMAARWTEMATNYLASQPQVKRNAGENSPRSLRSIQAEAARWNAMAAEYASR